MSTFFSSSKNYGFFNTLAKNCFARLFTISNQLQSQNTKLPFSKQLSNLTKPLRNLSNRLFGLPDNLNSYESLHTKEASQFEKTLGSLTGFVTTKERLLATPEAEQYKLINAAQTSTIASGFIALTAGQFGQFIQKPLNYSINIATDYTLTHNQLAATKLLHEKYLNGNSDFVNYLEEAKANNATATADLSQIDFLIAECKQTKYFTSTQELFTHFNRLNNPQISFLEKAIKDFKAKQQSQKY